MIGVIGLLKIELPGHTATISDAGFIVYAGDTYTTKDSILGTLASVESMSEGIGDEIPALDLTFNPPDNVAISLLSVGAVQKSRVRFWIAEYSASTGLVVGTPDLMFIGFVDQPVIKWGRGIYEISLSAVSQSEWFFERDTGNSLSAAFHKSLYPNETGHDNATGLGVAVAWGVSGPSNGVGFGGSGVGGGSGGGGIEMDRV